MLVYLDLGEVDKGLLVLEDTVWAERTAMAVCRVSTPPIPEVSCPVAENWCYTQVSLITFPPASVSLSM